jgi:hypothetical protein
MALRAGAGIAVILAAVLVYQLIRHNERRADIMSMAAQSPAAAAEMIARRFGKPEAVCHPGGPHDDIDNLVSALFAIERFGVAPFETTVETVAARLSMTIGLRPPDFSYGPGQIRLSRAVSLASETTPRNAAAPSGPESAPTHQGAALALLNACAARRVARHLIGAALDRPVAEAGSNRALARDQIMRVAAIYNAQAAPADGKAALAHRVYNLIAYHLTVHYRYADRHRPAASRTTTR